VWLGHDAARMAELNTQGIVPWPDENYGGAW
jgi:hypothetical protein